MKSNRQTAFDSRPGRRKGAMALEAKLGMFVITILVFAFGFIVYRKFDRQQKLASVSIPPQTIVETDTNAPPANGGDALNATTDPIGSLDDQPFADFSAGSSDATSGLLSETTSVGFNEQMDEPPQGRLQPAGTQNDAGLQGWSASAGSETDVTENSGAVPSWSDMAEPALVDNAAESNDLPSFDAMSAELIAQETTAALPEDATTTASLPDFSSEASAASSMTDPLPDPSSNLAATDSGPSPEFDTFLSDPQESFDPIAASDSSAAPVDFSATGTNDDIETTSPFAALDIPEAESTALPSAVADSEPGTSEPAIDFNNNAALAANDEQREVAVSLPAALPTIQDDISSEEQNSVPTMTGLTHLEQPETTPAQLPEAEPEPVPVLLAMNSPVQPTQQDDGFADWPGFDADSQSDQVAPSDPQEAGEQTPADPFAGNTFAASDLNDLELQPRSAPVSEPTEPVASTWPMDIGTTQRTTEPTAAAGSKFSVTAFQYQHDAPAGGGAEETWNVTEVRPGENYWTISRRVYGTSRYFSALALFNQNRIPDPKKMRQGMKILIPSEAKLESLYPQLFENQRPKRVLPAAFLTLEDGTPAYRVGASETLSEISQRFLGRSSRWIEIYRMNQHILKDPNKLKPGTVLALPNDAVQVHVIP